MFLLTIVNITAQQTPASKQAEPISIEGATAHLGNGVSVNSKHPCSTVPMLRKELRPTLRSVLPTSPASEQIIRSVTS